MVFKFILLFQAPIYFFEIMKKDKKFKEKNDLINIKAFEIFKYKESNDNYQNRTKLYQQIVKKALFIAKIFYFNYLFIIFSNNITSHFVYIKNIL